MKLDTERALAVAEGRISGRGCGKTTLAIANVCNHLLVGNDQIYCRIKKYRDLDYLFPMFPQIIYGNKYNEDGLAIIEMCKAKRRIVTSLGDIEFFPMTDRRILLSEDEQYLRGREGLIVDLVDY